MTQPTFKDQIDRIFFEISRAVTLCQQIRRVQRFDTIPTKLNRLEDALQSAPETLAQIYVDTRARSGFSAQFDRGDHFTSQACSAYIEDFETNITRKLKPFSEGNKELKRSPGFGKMFDAWDAIHKSLLLTISSHETNIQELYAPQPADAAPNDQTCHADEVIVSRQDYEDYLQLRERCWVEQVDCDGRSVWINCADPHRRTWVTPAGDFVRSATMQSARKRSGARN